MKVGITVVGT